MNKKMSCKTIFRSSQEQFWAGDFGSEYIKRNDSATLIAANIALFSRIFEKTDGIQSAIEFGANVGCNLHAIKALNPEAELSAIEINKKAAASLKKLPWLRHVYPVSIFDFKPDYERDLSFSKGVLIHINPQLLPMTYDLLFQSSKKYIVLVEYYSTKPTEVVYRGRQGYLFKRDFAGEMLDRFKDLELVDYGFAYHRDKAYPMVQDDLSWFLMKKRKTS